MRNGRVTGPGRPGRLRAWRGGPAGRERLRQTLETTRDLSPSAFFSGRAAGTPHGVASSDAHQAWTWLMREVNAFDYDDRNFTQHVIELGVDFRL
jgi:hypothetical protein